MVSHTLAWQIMAGNQTGPLSSTLRTSTDKSQLEHPDRPLPYPLASRLVSSPCTVRRSPVASPCRFPAIPCVARSSECASSFAAHGRVHATLPAFLIQSPQASSCPLTLTSLTLALLHTLSFLWNASFFSDRTRSRAGANLACNSSWPRLPSRRPSLCIVLLLHVLRDLITPLVPLQLIESCRRRVWCLRPCPSRAVRDVIMELACAWKTPGRTGDPPMSSCITSSASHPSLGEPSLFVSGSREFWVIVEPSPWSFFSTTKSGPQPRVWTAACISTNLGRPDAAPPSPIKIQPIAVFLGTLFNQNYESVNLLNP
jgi:hypothetical protein